MHVIEYKEWLQKNKLKRAPIDVSSLIGENALTLVLAVKTALLKEGWGAEELKTFYQTALSGDYDKVISICIETSDEGSYKNQGE